MREVIWLAGADADLQAIFDFLEERQPGRGVRFLDEINAELAWLREYPEGRPKKPAPSRKQRIADSPFAIFYTNEPRGVIVHAILDLRQEPRAICRLFGRDPDQPGG
jgi:plasmid stabilization system protein ParE